MLTAHLCSMLCWVYLLFLPLFSVLLRVPSYCVLCLYGILRLPGLFTILQTEVLSTFPHTTGLSIHHSRNMCFEYQCRCILVLCTILRTHCFVYTLTYTFVYLPFCLPLVHLPFCCSVYHSTYCCSVYHSTYRCSINHSASHCSV